MGKILRIGAVVCLILVAVMLSITLLDALLSRGAGVVNRKYIQKSDSTTQFRLDCKLANGNGYDCTYSQAFYDAAKVGDRLEFPWSGYTRLVRDGQTIKRDYSEDFVGTLVFVALGSLPSVLFVPAHRLPFRPFFHVLAGVIEFLLIGGTLYSLFASCC